MPNVINVSHTYLRIGSVITIPISTHYIVELCRVDWNRTTQSGTLNVYITPVVSSTKPSAPQRDWTRTATGSSPFPAHEERYEATPEPACSPRLR